MTKRFLIENLGELKVERKNIFKDFKFYINDIEAYQIDKKTYNVTINGEEVFIYISGGSFKGLFATIKDNKYQILKGIPWYFVILILMSLATPLLFAHISYFAEHGIYVVGGAVGGAIGGAFVFLASALCAAFEKWWIRLLICIGCMILSFAVCLGIGSLLVLLFN